tara:strand:+ start:6454 stop:7449 length:996 start_codon:yes stop_codon:yes gene_type:complete
MMNENQQMAFGPDVLAYDVASECDAITAWMRHSISRDLKRRGAVLGVSGGIDSAVCAALAVRALGAERVLALALPGNGTTAASEALAELLCTDLNLPIESTNIAPAIQQLGGDRMRDDAIAAVFPDLPPGSPHKIVVTSGPLDSDRARLFDLIAQAPDGSLRRARLPLPAYLQLVAATNMNQRARKLVEYAHAESHNFAVIGTPNRLEYELGFFVRGGDGLADIKPIAHLYKTQVYALAEHLGLPAAIREQVPSTETYTLPQSQEEFFFAMPLRQLDLLLWALHHNVPADAVAAILPIPADHVQAAYRDLHAKQRHAQQLLQPALTHAALQ